ncbi:leucine-rich repeat domain-containing protein [Lentzea sp. CA-135723]|uniref:leucine-rich repeat domain-containing protein n=1 Tax=Lentzea sp. CA-135723 TaxID=3239950 RepID=UPI003D94C732
MGDNENTPHVIPNRFAHDMGSIGKPGCRCFTPPNRLRLEFHDDVQDVEAPGWHRMLELIDEAAADGRTEFAPLREMSQDEQAQLVTLPPEIAKLTAVTRFVLYGSNLVRIPPEIGAMTSLEVFDPYTSYRLHWFPYEITRCTRLRDSTVSTRALYGNVKFRPPFPPTGDAPGDVTSCSVCTNPVTEPHQVWITLRVATDHLPLLVNACSAECVAALPPPSENYPSAPHRGGPGVRQPKPYH